VILFFFHCLCIQLKIKAKTQKTAYSFFDPTVSVTPLPIVGYPDRVLIIRTNSFFHGCLSHEISIREYAWGVGSAWIRQ
jgi:hypothetical protein